MARLRDATCAAILFPAILLGCQQEPAGTTPTDPASAATEATDQRGLPGIARDIADAIRAEGEVLRKALQSFDSITDADRQAYWSVLTKQRELADEMQALMTANPTWTESICEWYASQIQPADEEVIRMRNALNDRYDSGETRSNGTQRSDGAQLLMDAAGSADAARSHIQHLHDHPGSPTSLHIMCVKFGHIEEE